MGVILFFIFSYVLLSISLYFLFPKAGEEAWKGLVPGLNFLTWSKIIGKSSKSTLWLLFPIVNFFTFAGMCVDMARSFNKFSFLDSALSVIYAPAYFFKLAFSSDKYDGPALTKEEEFHASLASAEESGQARELKKLRQSNPYKKGPLREWSEAIIFAVFAAAFIRMFLIEAYVIPTGSMEGSLLVGDYLFVSKAHYGIRTPQTVAMLPLLHNRLPGNKGESYIEGPELPYFRLPAIESIDHNDPIVFNYPEGDSVFCENPNRVWSIHDYNRGSLAQQDPRVNNLIKRGKAKLITRPLDKRDHYVKRCIGLPGDSLEIRNKQVYINGTAAVNPAKIQFSYIISAPSGDRATSAKVAEELDIDIMGQLENGGYVAALNEDQIAALKAKSSSVKIEEFPYDTRSPLKTFPHDKNISANWGRDNYGPIWIPKKGATVQLSPANIAFYRRVIGVYEGNDFVEKGGKYIINGKEATEYTFKWDYYWAMGDNRHNSEDSRVWGFVPETHIVGKPWFIWFSTKNASIGNGIRWNRIFSGANKMD